MSFFSGSLNFIVILYFTYIHVSGEEPNSHVQNAEQSENKRRRPSSNPFMPIACRACDKIFFNNVSLVLHFECHLKDLGRSPIVLPRSPQHVAAPVMGEYSRARWLPNGDARSDQVLNTIPALISSHDARWGLLQSGTMNRRTRSTMNRRFSYPPFYTKSNRFSRFQRSTIGNFPISSNPEINLNQEAENHKEIIVISDDEKVNNNSPVEILDLTLKL